MLARRLPGNPAWDVRQIDWSTSDVRDDAARVNSRLYQPLEDTLFEDLGAVAGQRVDLVVLDQSALRVAWPGGRLDARVDRLSAN